VGGLIAAAYLTDLAAYTHSTSWVTWIWTWSLSIEEHFYLLWPATLWVALRRRLSPQLLAYGLAVVALVLDEVFARNGILGGPPDAYFQPQSHAFGLLIGCGLAVTTTPRWARHAAIPAIAGLVALAVLTPREYHISYLRFTVPAAALLTFALLAALEHSPAPVTQVLSWAPIRRIGVISYGLYLYNQLVFAVVAHYLTATHSVFVAVSAASALVAAEVSYRFYEAPIRRLGRRRVSGSRWTAQPSAATSSQS
jgi:peptidoglycan/LPS O-acetylase OafA/YrhL